jgi:ABC-type branched-subunit amino acid transport system ATPase component
MTIVISAAMKTTADSQRRETVLELRGIEVRFGGVTALSDLSLKISSGAGIEAIIGPNGAGKTTLFNVITGVVKPTAGRVFVAGTDVTPARLDRIFALGVSRTFQAVRLFDHISVLQNVMVAAQSAAARPRPRGGRSSVSFGARGSAMSVARDAMEAVGLPESIWEDSPAKLPHLQRRLIEIARAIASRPLLLLLDEPAAGLNTVEKEGISTLLRQLSSSFNCKIVVVEHDMKMIMAIAEHIWVINFGKLLASGPPSEIQNDQNVLDAYLGQAAK